jgi:hypothetical protein
MLELPRIISLKMKIKLDVYESLQYEWSFFTANLICLQL